AVRSASLPGSLHYHVASDVLWLDNLDVDADGVAMKLYRAHGYQYNPLFVAWWGLVHLQRHLRRPDQKSLDTFFTQVRWLRSQAVERADGAIVWPCHFDWQEGWCRLRAPWISAMYQGVVISALIRAYRMTGDRELVALCEAGARVFEKNVEEGGVRTVERGKVLYEEYPGYPLARVLDGFLFSLLGLHDLYVETRNVHWRERFNEGVAGLVANLDYWNYREKWSWYGSHGYLCPPHYHKLNYLLLSILGELTGEEVLTRRARSWDVNAKGRLDRMEIYLVYLITQNAARLRLPRQ
ncbi:MAG TPA: D-glucuronyl C5-epimerase family protein, partial [Candidatus Acidoferrales bacterium]|nr:D-glucuronyl C5-epimerase family protein [Candidatus Acidoferrales bacterium]